MGEITINHSSRVVFWALIACIVFAVYDARQGPLPVDMSPTPLLNDVAALAKQPHPMGSEEAIRQRVRLTEQLEAMGLQVSVQRTRVQYQHPFRHHPTSRLAWVENIIAQLPGTPGTGTVAFMSHYDSVWQGPGAGDAAAGVAAVLAAARAAAEIPERRNTLVFLLTDGEEMGLFGAQGFFRQHPLADDLDLVINFEARGNQGPPQMFQTSPDNAGLIQLLDQVIEHPVANSLSYEIYRRMPNDTDLTISMGEGIAGLNFAFIDGFPNYHARTDNPQLLSQRSLMQQAENAVRLSRHLVNADLGKLRQTGNLTYYNFSSHLFVAYPITVAWGLVALTLMVMVAGVRNALRRHVLTGSALLAASACLIAIGLLVYNTFENFSALYLAHAQWRDADFWRYFHLYKLNFLGAVLLVVGGVLWIGRRLSHGLPYRWLGALLLGLLAMGWWAQRPLPTALCLIVSALLLLTARRGLAPAAWLAAFGLLWSVALITLAVALPHASYVALLMVLPVGIILLTSRPQISGHDFSGWLGLLWVPGVLVMAALVYMVYLGVGTFMPQLPLTLAAVLTGGVLVPLGSPRSALSSALIAAGITVLVLAPQRFTFSINQPQPSSVFLITNTDNGIAHWASRDRQVPKWAQSVMDDAQRTPFKQIVPDSNGQFWLSDARQSPPIGPVLTQQTQSPDRVRLIASANAPAAKLYFDPAEHVASISVNGLAVNVEKPASLRLFALPKNATIDITTTPGDPLTVYWNTAIPGLPDTAPARPADHMPTPGTWSDTQVWHGIVRTANSSQ